jgi:hypothetical protein
MISSQVNVFDRFPEVTAEVERLAIHALNEAARAGAREAERVAAPGLKQHARMQVIPTHGEADGYASGFRSNAKGKRGQRIAGFHDRGTYGNFRGQLKRNRRGRAAKVPAVNPETGETTGIEALGFFGAGRRAGRRELLNEISRGL